MMISNLHGCHWKMQYSELYTMLSLIMNSNIEILIRNHLFTTLGVCKNNDEFIQHTAIPNKLFLENQKESIDYIRNYFLGSLPDFSYTIKYKGEVLQ